MNKMRHLSKEHKRKIVETRRMKGSYIAWNKGLPKELQPMYNKKHSIETKRKMSESSKRRGNNNIFFGTHEFSSHKLEKHPNWKGGLSFEPYGIEFNENLKEFIRQRDNFICRLCGLKQNGYNFDIHHIDFNKKNNDKENLITLCNHCHIKTQFNRDFWLLYFVNLKKVLGV